MKALTWHGKRDVRVDDVPDPTIEQPTDAIIRVTSSGLCGSDLHLYEVLGPFIDEGDVLGHEPMGIVEEVGAEVTNLAPGDRVVIPFNISCGHCFMCEHGLQSQCETTQVREQGMGAALFGYTQALRPGPRRAGRVPARAAGAVRADQGPRGPARRPLPVPLRRAADRLAGGAVRRRAGGRDASRCIGLGPIGEMACRIAQHLGAEHVIGLDLVPERLARSAAHGVRTIDVTAVDDVAGRRARADGRPRPGRRDRRRRHRGARRAGRQARPHARRAAARRRREKVDARRRASTG